MKVGVEELRAAANVLFDHLEEMGNTEIEIDDDYYWCIPDDKMYSVYEQPVEFTMGQLSDDLEAIRALGSGTREPIAYALVWLSSVLRYVGAKVVA